MNGKAEYCIFFFLTMTALSATAATTYTVTLSHNNGVCTQDVNGTNSNWVPVNQGNQDKVIFKADPHFSKVVVVFPAGSAVFPGTPFFDDDTGNWQRKIDSSAEPKSRGTTLTPHEEVGRFRFQYASVTLTPNTGPGTSVSCSFPAGGMGIQVTK